LIFTDKDRNIIKNDLDDTDNLEIAGVDKSNIPSEDKVHQKKTIARLKNTIAHQKKTKAHQKKTISHQSLIRKTTILQE